MDDEEGDGMSEGCSFSDLDRAALASIAARLDGPTLALFQATNSRVRDVCLDDMPWREAFKREFPIHYESLAASGLSTPWRQLYQQRQTSERRWATGQLAHPSEALIGHEGGAFALAVMDSPFEPNRYLISGSARDNAAHPELDGGELAVWDLKTPIQPAGRQCWMLRPPGGPQNANIVRRGVFYAVQRPGTDQFVCPSTASDVNVVRFIEKSKLKAAASDDVSMDVDNNDTSLAPLVNGSSSGALLPLQQQNQQQQRQLPPPPPIEVQHIYTLVGHDATCTWTRVRCDKHVFTNSFDGRVHAYILPEVSEAPPLDGNVDGADNQHHRPRTVTPSAVYHHCEPGPDVETLSPPETAQYRSVCAMDVSVDATRMATGGNDMLIKLWDITSGQILSRLRGCRGWVWDLEICDDALHTALSCSTDGVIRTWDFRSHSDHNGGGGDLVAEYDCNTNHPDQVFPVGGVALREDKLYYAAACFDSTVHVVDRRMNRAVAVLQGHRDRIGRVVISGDTIISADFAGEIRLWQF